MVERNDPHGKRALYWKSAGDEVVVPTQKGSKQNLKDTGRRALFSDLSGGSKEGESGPIQLECSNCHEISYVELIDYMKAHFPLWLWIPGKKYSRYLKCPSCSKHTWVRARITLLANELAPSQDSE